MSLSSFAIPSEAVIQLTDRGGRYEEFSGRALVRYQDEEAKKWLIASLGGSVTDAALARLAGAPDGAKVAVSLGRQARNASPTVHMEVAHPKLEHAEYWLFQRAGVIVLYGQSLWVKRREQAQGFGTRLFATQVGAARTLRIARIECVAAGQFRHPEGWNGYYVWARLGFNGEIPAWRRGGFPVQFRYAADMNDLITREGGAEWWRRHGASFEAWFDTDPSSTSSQLLEAYLKEHHVERW